MKIVHIINNLHIGGAESLISTLLPKIKDMGIDCQLICLNGINESKYINELETFHIPIHILNKKSSPYHPILILKIGRLLQKINPDIVHVHLFPAFYWAALAKKIFGLKSKFLFTEHATFNRRQSIFWWKPLELFVYRQYQQIICISGGVENRMKKYIQGKFITKIENGIPLEKYRQNNPVCLNASLAKQVESLHSIKENKLILSVGRLVPDKNQQTMIRMMTVLSSDYLLLIVGEGQCRTELEKLIQSLKLENRIFLLGTQTDIPYLIKQAHAGIFTSKVEGFGLAALEMMASGLPVAFSSVPGLNELCPDESLMASQDDYNQFAIIIKRLMQDESYYQQMKEKCLSRSDTYSIQEMANKHIKLYQQVLSDSPNPEMC